MNNNGSNAVWIDELGVQYSCDQKRLIAAPKNIFEYTILNGVTTIGESAFADCHSLRRIDIPSSVRRVEPYAFSCCYELCNFYIPDTIEVVGKYAFDPERMQNYERVIYVDFVDENNWAEYSADRKVLYELDACYKYSEYRVLDGTEAIGACVAYNALHLTSLYLPSSIHKIARNAFLTPVADPFPIRDETWAELTIYVPRGAKHIENLVRESGFNGTITLY